MLLVMRIFDFKFLFAILSLLSVTLSFNLKCVDDDELYPGTCVVVDLVITSPDDTITSVNEIPDPSERYISLKIQNQDVKYVPKGIAIFFPKLEHLEISNSKLQWIEQDDIKGLVHLKTLDLNGNILQMLEESLFDFNTELEEIKLQGNQLVFVPNDVFYNLQNLKTIDLHDTTCWRAMQNDYNTRYVEENQLYYRDTRRDLLRRYCQQWETVGEVYKSHFNEKIIRLRSQISALKSDLTHRLSTCDGNFDAALENLHQQKFMNSNAMRVSQNVNDSIAIDLACAAPICVATDFKVPFPHLLIDKESYKHQNITSLHIHLQQTLFMPQNLAELFTRLSNLSVIESGLFEIEYSVFEGFDLIDLNLTKNKILEVPADTFADMENLEALDLSYNNIHTLPNDVFANLKALQKLYLNHNYLISIKVELLKNLESLKELKLSNNRLKFIGATLLSPLTGLELVDLSSNVCINMQHPTSTLMEVEEKIIDNCIAPVDLNCKRNDNGEIAVDENVCQVEGVVIKYPKTKVTNSNAALNNYITVLLCDNQSIKFFPYQLSQHLPNLQRLEIKKSKLTTLHPMDFQGFSKLTEIVINENNLSSIIQGSFSTIPQLELLDLSSNNIVSLPMKIFAKLTRLHTLRLSNNQIVKFSADILPRKNSINVFCVDNNQLEFIETKTIRFLRKAKLIDLTENVCIDMKFAKSENSTRALVELSGEIDLNCSLDEYEN